MQNVQGPGWIDPSGTKRLVFLKDAANSRDEGGRIKLGPHDFVGAIGEDGDPPIADKRDELIVLRGLDRGAKVLCFRYAAFALDINQDQVVGRAAEHRNSFSRAERRVDAEA